MYSLRRVAFRALTLKPSASITLQARNFSSSINRVPIFKTSSSLISRQQLRWASEEAAATTTEEAAASEEEPPVTEEEAAVSAAAEPTTTESVETPNQVDPSPIETVKDTAVSATEAVKETLGSATQTVSQTLGTQDPALEVKTVYVGNLFFDVRSEDLEREFAKAGQVVSARVITDIRGLSKGFGYIEFETPAQAADAISQFHLQNFEGRRLNVAYANKTTRPSNNNRRDGGNRSNYTRADGPLNEPTKTLFIGNMSFDMSDRDLNTLFRSVKNVVDVRVAIDRRTGQPRGFAHADFVDVESATKALDELKGKMVLGRELRIDYSMSTGRAAMRAEPRDDN